MNHSSVSTRHSAGLATGIVALSLLTSCGSLYQKHQEQLVRAAIEGNEEAPTWVRGEIQRNATELAFVGRGMAFNVLDERKAFDEAMMHAREQLANYISTRVMAESCDQDWAKGARFLPIADAGPGDGESVAAMLKFRTKQMTDAVVGELLPVGQYWEQWDVQEDPERHWHRWGFTNHNEYEMRRYKCWVLATVPKQSIDKFVQASLDTLRNEANAALAATHAAELEAMELAMESTRDSMQTAMNEQFIELQSLRERVKYGRAFRLTTQDNCPTPDPCVPLARPDWRNASLTIKTHVATEVKTAEKPADFCASEMGGK